MSDKQKHQKQDSPEQSERFVEKAREVEADETGEEFERAIRKVVPARKAPRRQNDSF